MFSLAQLECLTLYHADSDMGLSKTQNKSISFLYIFHYSKPFFAFQPANIISVHYNVGELIYSMH